MQMHCPSNLQGARCPAWARPVKMSWLPKGRPRPAASCPSEVPGSSKGPRSSAVRSSLKTSYRRLAQVTVRGGLFGVPGQPDHLSQVLPKTLIFVLHVLYVCVWVPLCCHRHAVPWSKFSVGFLVIAHRWTAMLMRIMHNHSFLARHSGPTQLLLLSDWPQMCRLTLPQTAVCCWIHCFILLWT